MARKTYDLAVIGTGTAGQTIAFACREAGLKVAVVDNRPYGGTCALRGCNPKKVIYGIAETAERSLAMKGRGILREASIDWPALMKFKRTFTEPRPRKTEGYFREEGIETLHGMARFIGRNALYVEGEGEVEAGKIAVATGARPSTLNFEGAELVSTSDQFLELDALPESIMFIGGGYVSFELANIARAAGASARILHRSARVLKNFDPDLAGMLVAAYRRKGIEVNTNEEAGSVEKKDGSLVVRTVGGSAFEAEMVVHGAGRVPDIEGLDLEKAGVERNRSGISVNEYMQSVSNPDVYAAGDCASPGPPLTPVAGLQGRAAAGNIVNGNRVKVDYSGIPSVVFTTPMLASVGLTEDDAKGKGLGYEVRFSDTSEGFDSRRLGLTASGYKVLLEKGSGKVLGAHLLGENADEVINIFAMAIRLNIPAAEIRKVVWAYPTSSTDVADML